MAKWIVHILDSCNRIHSYWRIVQADIQPQWDMTGVRSCGTGISNYGEDGYESCEKCLLNGQFPRNYRLLEVFPYSKEAATKYEATDFGLKLEAIVDVPVEKK